MSAFEELERQLAQSVAARSRTRASAAMGGLGRWWRGRLGSTALALAVAVGLIVVAGAMSTPGRRAGRREASLDALMTASVAESSCLRCRAVGGRLHGPLSEEDAAADLLPRVFREVLVRRGIPAVLWATEARRLR